MYFRFLFILCFISPVSKAQIRFSERELALGTIPEAFEIKGDITLRNTSSKKIYLMRADADKGVKIYTSKKALLPDDTCLLVISFIPETNGRFNKTIDLISSDQAIPYHVVLSGNLTQLKSDDKAACYYFGTRRNNAIIPKEMSVVTKEPEEKRDNTNKIPDRSSATHITITPSPKSEEPNATELSNAYRPNNIVFLVDISGSMKDSLKLPLMKNAIHFLINAVRSIDRISFVTYADTVVVVSEAVSGSDKKALYDFTDGLKAKGLTKGNKAILFSQRLAQKHFIAGGNNQLFLATDGKFTFNDRDFKTWTEAQQDKKIILSVVAFGTDPAAIKNLKEIAEKGEGSFIHIKKRNGSRDKLLDEIKERSQIH